MADNQQIDRYDFINAPQFVDFNDLAAQDDPDADRFFETHREEDDFILDIDSLSPTVQLLNDENVHYSNEANKAALAAGLEDVKIEYYASPQQPQPSSVLSQPSSNNQRSITSVYGTPLGGASGFSSSASFHTPTGGEDKENVTPSPKPGSLVKKVGGKVEENEVMGMKNIRNVLSEYIEVSVTGCATSTAPDGSKIAKPVKSTAAEPSPSQSLYAQLNKLVIVSSDEEDNGLSPVDDEPLLPHQLSTGQQNTDSYSTFSAGKLSYLGFGSTEQRSAEKSETENRITDTLSDGGEESDATLMGNTPINRMLETLDLDSSSSFSDNEEGGATAMELRTPIRNILKKLDAELNLEDAPRYSIVVDPAVGQQVHWSNEGIDHAVTSEEAEAHSSFGNRRDSNVSFNISSTSTIIITRRASSVGDLRNLLVRDVEPRERDFETYGYNPRAGLTIPKTPDISQLSEDRPASRGQLRPVYHHEEDSCYFEIEAPKKRSIPKAKNLRRVSSCGDLVKLLGTKPKTRPRMGLTVPRTPDTSKRHRSANTSNISCASSNTGRATARNPIKTVPNVAERLTAAAQRRQPIKANHYVSMAEAMVNFHKHTPDRFRTLPKGRIPEKRSASCDSRKRTSPSPASSHEAIPETASGRARADSFSERKAAIKCVKSNNGPVLPKKIELKPTVPQPFKFGSTHRPRAAVTKKDEDTTDFKFKARPAPTKILQDVPIGVKAKAQIKITKPMSPHFASDDRLRERHEKRTKNATESPDPKPVKLPKVHTSRIPTNALVNRTHADEHKTTVTQPFSSSFDARQKEILRRKEEKIKQELKEAGKRPEFHANPMPKLQSKLPKKKPVEATHVEPFRLHSDERGAVYQEEFRKKVEEEERQLKEQAEFHAQPADVLNNPPFEPEKSSKVVEGPCEFQLATEKRAAEREKFDDHLREKEKQEEEEKREEQERLLELQRQEDIERRRQLVHKAQPFKAPKQFQLKPSGKQLTVPQSPAFAALPSDRRQRARSQQEEPSSPKT